MAVLMNKEIAKTVAQEILDFLSFDSVQIVIGSNARSAQVTFCEKKMYLRV